ncbi:MAG: Glu/Leu/Phe/Val dehydrogenase dimerization domain-containing protein [Thermoanaerobaculia bacterium]
MPENLVDLIRSWDGIGVITRYDSPTETWIFICLHDDSLGACTGGTRMKVYASPAEGLRDAMRLATGMTAKWAGIGMAAGGGKAVLVVPRLIEGAERRGLLERYGALVETLGGSFHTGEDLGTTTEDLRFIGETTHFVHGFDPDTGEKIDPSPYTARGVLAAIKAGLAHTFSSADPTGRSILIQGTGNVGRELAQLLARADATLLLSDIDTDRSDRLAGELGARAVAPDEVYTTACDVYAPCAVGATLTKETIPLLACRLVAGSANNQLEESADAERLAERDILYVPDFIANSGGAMAFGLLSQGAKPGETLFEQIDTIGERVTDVLREAAERHESPLAAAERRVQETLAEARAERLDRGAAES